MTRRDSAAGARVIWDLPLSDGGIRVELGDQEFFVRPIRADDAEALENAFGEMSPRSRYLRFFAVRERLGAELVRKLTDIDHVRHRAWVVANPSEPSTVGTDEGRGVAVARLVVVDDQPRTAEAALAVVDDHQGRGIGRLLLDLLISTARASDIDYLRFETLPENEGMKKLIDEHGGELNRALTSSEVLVYEVSIAGEPDDADVVVGGLYEILRYIAASDVAAESGGA